MRPPLTFKDILAHHQQQLPFVLYRKPQEQEVYAILQQDQQLHTVNDYEEQGFVFAPFNSVSDSYIIKGEREVLAFAKSDTTNPITSSLQDFGNAFARAHHINIVEKAIERIKESELKKVVLSRSLKIDATTSAVEVFERMLLKYANAFVYYFFHPAIGSWLGATPERLLKIKGSTFETMALAGTQVFHESEDVTWGDKEKEEQQFVTDEIISRLSAIDLTTLSIGERHTHKAGNLLHLRTKINGRLDQGLDLKNIINALHPTPAVCGLPREEARDFILENEGYARNFYTGFLGELNLEETTTRNRNRRNVENSAYYSVKRTSDLYVNLRCMEQSDNAFTIYVGGGITASSNPAAEWEETVNKAQTMASVI